jgi:negative regulator of sigma E activity
MADPTNAHFQPDGRPVDEQLADLRVRIDVVDQQLLTLLNDRAKLAQAVGEVKKIDGSPVFRPASRTATQGRSWRTAWRPSGAKSCRPAARWKRANAWPF